MSVFGFLRRSKQKAAHGVTYTDDAVSVVRSDGIAETIRWDDLDEVGVLTTDEGPFREDVFFLLTGADGKSGCVVPQSSDGCDQLLERLQQLPGFDHEAVIKAMSSTSKRKVCVLEKASRLTRSLRRTTGPAVDGKMQPTYPVRGKHP